MTEEEIENACKKLNLTREEFEFGWKVYKIAWEQSWEYHRWYDSYDEPDEVYFVMDYGDQLEKIKRDENDL